MSADPFDNLRPVPPRPLTDRAKRMIGRVAFAHEIEPVLERDYIVKGWLDRSALSVVYGEANAGKSFWAIDLAHHVQQGLAWNGRRVRTHPVLYVAAEGGAMFDNRLAARKAKFMVLRGGLTLAGRFGEAEPLAEAMDRLAATHGAFGLVVIDTLARVMGGADENAAADIGALVRAAEIIRDRTGAHVMFIHHCGKDVARGARGHSALRAAVDTEIEISRGEDGTRLARTTKQRDLPGGAEHEFTLEEVTLGRDSDGDPVTSCIVRTKGGQAQAELRV